MSTMIDRRMSDTPISSLTNNPYVITAEGQTKQMLLVWSAADQTTQPIASLPLQKWVIDSYGCGFSVTRWRQELT